MELVKRLLGEGCEVRVWDEDVRLGRLAGSNRQYIEEVIPHIGALLTTDLKEALANAEVVIVGTRALDSRELAEQLRPGQMVIDLVNLARSRRPTTEASYEGVCW